VTNIKQMITYEQVINAAKGYHLTIVAAPNGAKRAQVQCPLCSADNPSDTSLTVTSQRGKVLLGSESVNLFEARFRGIY
jgi:hypothetical protein